MNDIEQGSGLTGFLTPWGTFYECVYMEHHIAAEKMYYIALATDNTLRGQIELGESKEAFLKRSGFCSMGSKGRYFPSMSHVQFPDYNYINENAKPLTDTQVDWFEDNIKYLDKTQRNFVAKYICLYVSPDHGKDDEVEERFKKYIEE